MHKFDDDNDDDDNEDADDGDEWQTRLEKETNISERLSYCTVRQHVEIDEN